MIKEALAIVNNYNNFSCTVLLNDKYKGKLPLSSDSIKNANSARTVKIEAIEAHILRQNMIV